MVRSRNGRLLKLNNTQVFLPCTEKNWRKISNQNYLICLPLKTFSTVGGQVIKKKRSKIDFQKKTSFKN